jgi:hypothetical protein
MDPGSASWSLEIMEDMRDEGPKVTDCAFSGAKGAEDGLASDSFVFVMAFALFLFSLTRQNSQQSPVSDARNND